MTRPCSGVLSAASVSSTGGGSAVGFFEPLLFAFRGMSASYAKIAAVAQPRKTLDANAYALMLALTRAVLPHADVRRALWRGLTKGAADRLLRARRAAGRRRHRAGQSAALALLRRRAARRYRAGPAR